MHGALDVTGQVLGSGLTARVVWAAADWVQELLCGERLVTGLGSVARAHELVGQ